MAMCWPSCLTVSGSVKAVVDTTSPFIPLMIDFRLRLEGWNCKSFAAEATLPNLPSGSLIHPGVSIQRHDLFHKMENTMGHYQKAPKLPYWLLLVQRSSTSTLSLYLIVQNAASLQRKVASLVFKVECHWLIGKQRSLFSYTSCHLNHWVGHFSVSHAFYL